MGLFNTLRVDMSCPHCQTSHRQEVEVKFGWKNQLDYVRGDKVWWAPEQPIEHGGRPHGGQGSYEGYCECQRCGKDFFVEVHVVEDRITGATVDSRRLGHLA